MGVYHVVQLLNKVIFKTDHSAAYWRDVERHAVIAADAHECVIQDQKGITYWSIPEVSVELFPIPVGGHF